MLYLHLCPEVLNSSAVFVVKVEVVVTDGAVETLQRFEVLLQLSEGLSAVHLVTRRLVLGIAPFHHVLHSGPVHVCV